MVASSPSELMEDQISWLLVTAYNYLQQGLSDQAVTLLEFLHTFDPDNFQCLRMLAYGYFMRGEEGKSAELINALRNLSLTKEQHDGVRLLQSACFME